MTSYKHYETTEYELYSLGVRVHVSRGYMVITLWFFKHFAQQETTGYMLSYFTKKIALWSPCTQGSNCDYIWKENTTLITMYPAITWWLISKRKSTKTSGFFVKENPSFFHNFVHNVSTLDLSHSFRVLSQSAPQYNQNVPSRFFSKKPQRNHTVAQFYHKLSKNSLSIWLNTLWLHCGVLYERSLNEWLGSRVNTLWTKLWKKLGFSFTKNPLVFVLFLFEINHHVIAGYIVIKVVFSFQM